MQTKQLLASVLLLTCFGSMCAAEPLGTAFTYQGRLTEGGNPANGNYDLRFILYNADAGGSQAGSILTNAGLGVANGLFMATLDFGTGIFNGSAYWLEVDVRTNGGAAAFTTLSPRQPLRPTPYALYAPSAGVAASAETSVTASSVAANAVTGAAIQDGSVTSSKLTDGAVTPAKLNTAGATTGQGLFFDGTSAVWQMPPGDITEVIAGDGLNGGGASGPVTLGVNFDGAGSATSVARSDHNHSATHITSGTMADARLSTNVALLDAHQTFAGTNTFAGVSILTNAANRFDGSFAGDGSGLTNLSAGSLASGLIDDARLSPNVALLNGSPSFSGAVTATTFSGSGASLTSLNGGALANDSVTSAKLADDAASLARVTGGNMTVSSGNVGVGVTPAGDNKLEVNGRAFAEDGIATGEGSTGSGMRFGAAYPYWSSQTIASFSRGSVWWDSSTSQVILTNKHSQTYIHYVGHKREDMSGSGSTSFISGYVVPTKSTVLATLDSNGEHLVVDIAGRRVGEGFVHLYCYYDNGSLVCNYYYRCE